MLKQS
jgi:hypothetical protein